MEAEDCFSVTGRGVNGGDFRVLPGFALSPEGIWNVQHLGVYDLRCCSSTLQMLCPPPRTWEPSWDAVDTSVPEPT